MALKICSDRVEPFFPPRRKRGGPAEPQLCRQRPRKNFSIRSAEWQAMICSRASDAGCRLDYIQPVHLRTAAIPFEELIQVAAAREFSGVTDVSRAATQKIGVERENDVGLLHAVNRVEVTAEGELRAFARAVADGRLPLVPLGFRKKRQQRLNLCGERR